MIAERRRRRRNRTRYVPQSEKNSANEFEEPLFSAATMPPPKRVLRTSQNIVSHVILAGSQYSFWWRHCGCAEEGFFELVCRILLGLRHVPRSVPSSSSPLRDHLSYYRNRVGDDCRSSL